MSEIDAGTVAETRNLLAISIKHTEYKWRLGMPCVLWGHRTEDNAERRSFGGYTLYPNRAELYSLEEWQSSGYGSCIKTDEPVRMEMNFCRKYHKYDTVLVPYDHYLAYCEVAGLALDKQAEGDDVN